MRFLFLLLTCLAASTAAAQPAQREPTDIYIRRLAGLSAESAAGQIEIIDVGHSPMDTMVTIVANRTDKGWSVSYACASSPHCAPSQDHWAASYIVSEQAGAEIDAILKKLEGGKEPDGQPPTPTIIGGILHVSIDDHGFKRDYRRVIWGHILGRLESLLNPSAS